MWSFKMLSGSQIIVYLLSIHQIGRSPTQILLRGQIFNHLILQGTLQILGRGCVFAGPRVVLPEQLHFPSLLCLFWPSGTLLRSVVPTSVHGATWDAGGRQTPWATQNSDPAGLWRDPRPCPWQAPPDDLECTLGNPALKTSSSSSGSHESHRPACTQHFTKSIFTKMISSGTSSA